MRYDAALLLLTISSLSVAAETALLDQDFRRLASDEVVNLQEAYAERGVQFVGVAIDDVENVRAFVAESRLNYPTLHGQGDAIELGKRLGNITGGLPFTAVIVLYKAFIKMLLQCINALRFTVDENTDKHISQCDQIFSLQHFMKEPFINVVPCDGTMQ